MFSIFNRKKRIFFRNLNKIIKAREILSGNPYMMSINEREIARRNLKEITDWWEINVDNYKNELSITEGDFELLRYYLQLPDIAKYRRETVKR